MSDELTALLIGPTDKTKIFRFGKLREEDYDSHIEDIAKVLAEKISVVYLIPDAGAPLDVANVYKKLGGKKVVGVLPEGGYPALEKYFCFCDEIEEIEGDWRVLNTCLSKKTGLMIGFGLSPTTMVEICYARYHKNFSGKRIVTLLDEITISGRLHPEVEEGVDLRYFNSPEELSSILESVNAGKY